VPNEIAYETVFVAIVASLSKSHKKWSSFPISLGIFSLLNEKHALKVEKMEGI